MVLQNWRSFNNIVALAMEREVVRRDAPAATSTEGAAR